MNLTDLTLRLLIIFFPGIICHLVVDALTVHKKRQPFQVFLFAYVYGVLTYVVLGVVACIFSIRISRTTGITIPPPELGFTKLFEAGSKLDYLEIFFGTLLSVPIAFALSRLYTRKTLHHWASRLNVSNKFGDPNVWSFVLNSTAVRWAVLRDREQDMMYEGFIQAFSDIDEVAEILLLSVVVYKESTGKKLYEADRMYLSRNRASITLQFPKTGEGS